MSFTVTIPFANIDAANASLQASGWGPQNFRTPIYTTTVAPAFATLEHIGNDAAFQAACAALAGAVVRTSGSLVANMAGTVAAVSGRWGTNAPLLQGNVTPGLYRAIPADGGGLWLVIQAFDRAVFGQALSTLASLVRKARTPGAIEPWVQPIDAFDAYFTRNKFTGQPDRVTHLGRIQRSAVADPTPNVWAPDGAEWVDEGAA